MTIEAQETTTLRVAASWPASDHLRRGRALFTLFGGRLFSVYDRSRAEGIDIVDVRHRSAATFRGRGFRRRLSRDQASARSPPARA